MDFNNLNQESSWIPSKAYIEGYTACNCGKMLTDNPFSQEAPSYKEWEHGYCDAEGYDDYINGRIDLDARTM